MAVLSGNGRQIAAGLSPVRYSERRRIAAERPTSIPPRIKKPAQGRRLQHIGHRARDGQYFMYAGFRMKSSRTFHMPHRGIFHRQVAGSTSRNQKIMYRTVNARDKPKERSLQAIGSGHCPAGAGITYSAGISPIHYRGEQDARVAVYLTAIPPRIKKPARGCRLHNSSLHSLFTRAARCRSTRKSALTKNVERAAQMAPGTARHCDCAHDFAADLLYANRIPGEIMQSLPALPAVR